PGSRALLMPATIARRRCFVAPAADWSPNRVVPHQAARCGSPGDILQVWWKERPISETILVKGTDQVLPSLPLFFRIPCVNPRLEERDEFRATILWRQRLIQQLQGVR